MEDNEDNMEFVDNHAGDPDFEPKRKKQKKDHELISNELMLYAINKFGKDFFSENDRKERKVMCEMIRNDLITEKGVVIDHEIIYNNLVSQKRTFLSEKKKHEENNSRQVIWPFFNAYLALGDCIKSESSSDRKHSSSKNRKHSSKSRKSSSSKETEKSSRRKDDSIKTAAAIEAAPSLEKNFVRHA